MLQRNMTNPGSNPPSWWEELGHGAPTIAAYARLCADAIQLLPPADQRDPDALVAALSPESQTILMLASQRGTFEIRSNRESFNSAERFLAVSVEQERDQWRVLLDKRNPAQTVRFLDGFRELCRQGFILHHLHREFSLSAQGYQVASRLAKIDDLLEKTPELLALREFGFQLEL